MAKRILLFVTVNILIVATISVVMSMLGVQPYLTKQGINYQSLLIFCVLWGFGGAFISLMLSRIMAKWMMGVKLITLQSPDADSRDLVQRVNALASRAGLKVMPEVGVYESDEINAFATGPTKNRSLVAVSTGLLQKMNRIEVDGVLAHEVAHISNGDMVTMSLVQGVVNAFVMFLARVAAFFIGQLVDEERRGVVQFVVVLALEIVLGVLGMLVVASFSRRREFRADEGGARLAGKQSMIAALEKLKSNLSVQIKDEQPALSTLKIYGQKGRLLSLFSTHPDLDLRIKHLRSTV